MVGRSDDLIVKNESASNAPRLVSLQDFLGDIAGANLTVNTNNRQLDATGGGGGATTLFGLTDVPAISTGNSGDGLLINIGETGVAWGDSRDGRVSAMGFVAGG